MDLDFETNNNNNNHHNNNNNKNDMDQEENFELYYTDIILNLYYDIQHRFPYFLDRMRFHNVMTLLIDCKFKKNVLKKNVYQDNIHLLNFEKYYFTEIDVTFECLNNKIKNLNIDYLCWLEFCFEHTSLIPVRNF